MFKELAGDSALMKSGGVYKTADLYVLDGGLYAKWGSGFVRLRKDGTTSKDGVNFLRVHSNRSLWADAFGRVTLYETDGGPQLALTSGSIGGAL